MSLDYQQTVLNIMKFMGVVQLPIIIIIIIIIYLVFQRSTRVDIELVNRLQ